MLRFHELDGPWSNGKALWWKKWCLVIGLHSPGTCNMFFFGCKYLTKCKSNCFAHLFGHEVINIRPWKLKSLLNLPQKLPKVFLTRRNRHRVLEFDLSQFPSFENKGISILIVKGFFVWWGRLKLALLVGLVSSFNPNFWKPCLCQLLQSNLWKPCLCQL